MIRLLSVALIVASWLALAGDAEARGRFFGRRGFRSCGGSQSVSSGASGGDCAGGVCR